MNISKNVINLIWRPSDYITEAKEKEKSESALPKNIQEQMQDWRSGKKDYQICFVLENGTVQSTGVTKSLIDRFVSKESLSAEERESINQFIQLAIGSDLEQLSDTQLRIFSKLLSQSNEFEALK